MSTYMTDGNTISKLLELKKKSTTPVTGGGVTGATGTGKVSSIEYTPPTTPKNPIVTNSWGGALGVSGLPKTSSPEYVPPTVGQPTTKEKITPPASFGSSVVPDNNINLSGGVLNNQGNTTTIGNTTPTVAPNNNTLGTAPTTPTVTPTPSATTTKTLSDWANENNLSLGWDRTTGVSLEGVPIDRALMEANGGVLVNGRWTFPNSDAIMNVVTASLMNPSTGGTGSGGTEDYLAGMDSILADYREQLNAISSQIQGLNISDYQARAFESLRPMLDYQTNQLTGTADVNRLRNEAGQESRGLGNSNLYKANNMQVDKLLNDALVNLNASFNEQALSQGMNMYNADMNRLSQLYNLTEANFGTTMDVLNTKLDTYFKNVSVNNENRDFLYNATTDTRNFNRDNLESDRAYAEQVRMNDHSIAMDNWTKSFQERNAASLAQTKTTPWGVDAYSDDMYITRQALIEMMFDPSETASSINNAWKQATLEFPELTQDAGLQTAISDALRTRPSYTPEILTQ